MRTLHTAIAAIGLLIAGVSGAAEAPPPPCSAPEHRQFDFWLGSWEVTSPQGQRLGINEITRELGGCVLHEHWVGGRGMKGESFNAYDAARRVWHQTWMDDRGTVLLLDGGLREGNMVLEGTLPGPSGKPVRQRITWTPKSPDEVHQHWEAWVDSSASWSTSFLGVYRRAKR